MISEWQILKRAQSWTVGFLNQARDGQFYVMPVTFTRQSGRPIEPVNLRQTTIMCDVDFGGKE